MTVKLREAATILGQGEGAGPKGTRWRVRVIEAGQSKSGFFYPLETLHAAAPKFNGARVLVRSDEDHVQGRNTNAALVEGWLENASPSPEGIDADLVFLPSAATRQKLTEAWEAGKKDLLGFSIVADGRAKQERKDGMSEAWTWLCTLPLVAGCFQWLQLWAEAPEVC